MIIRALNKVSGGVRAWGRGREGRAGGVGVCVCVWGGGDEAGRAGCRGG